MTTRQYSQTDLLQLARAEHAQMEKLIALLTPEEMCLPGVIGEWSIKDLLFHLVSWERQLIAWLQDIDRDEIPDVPLSKKEIDCRNAEVYATNRTRSLEEALAEFRHSHAQSLAAIEAFAPDKLAGIHRIPDGWSRLSVAWLAGSCMDRHYRGHRGSVRRWMKEQGKL